MAEHKLIDKARKFLGGGEAKTQAEKIITRQKQMEELMREMDEEAAQRAGKVTERGGAVKRE